MGMGSSIAAIFRMKPSTMVLSWEFFCDGDHSYTISGMHIPKEMDENMWISFAEMVVLVVGVSRFPRTGSFKQQTFFLQSTEMVMPSMKHAGTMDNVWYWCKFWRRTVGWWGFVPTNECKYGLRVAVVEAVHPADWLFSFGGARLLGQVTGPSGVIFSGRLTGYFLMIYFADLPMVCGWFPIANCWKIPRARGQNISKMSAALWPDLRDFTKTTQCRLTGNAEKLENTPVRNHPIKGLLGKLRYGKSPPLIGKSATHGHFHYVKYYHRVDSSCHPFRDGYFPWDKHHPASYWGSPMTIP